MKHETKSFSGIFYFNLKVFFYFISVPNSSNPSTYIQSVYGNIYSTAVPSTANFYSAVRGKKGGGRWGLVQSEEQKMGGEVVHFGGQGIGKP